MRCVTDKQKMNVRRTILFLAAAALLTGCFKDVSTTTNYVIKPLVQDLSGDPYLALDGVKAYAFDADTTLYPVASYADALEGVASLKGNPSERLSPFVTAGPYEREGTSGWVQMSMSNATQMVLAVDTEHRIYAYTQQELTENLPTLYVTLPFKPWKEGFSYKDGSWSYYNEFYTPPTYLDCFIDPAVQSEEGGAAEEISNLKAYAFAADTAAWYIASYDDAVAGKITSKDDDSFTRSNPNFTAYKEEGSSLYKMQVSTGTLMVVVVDRVDRLYAYTKKEVDLEGAPPTFSVLFRPWVQQWIDTEEPDGWVVVNPALDPDPDKDSQTQTQPRRR